MRRNIEKMANVAEERGVKLRPHVKTHKIPSIAKEQLGAGAAGITVAKVSEAEIMADAGIQDIFIAYPIVTESKIKRVLSLSRKTNITVGVDRTEGARRLSKLAALEDDVLDVRLEVDTGLRRTGALFNEAVELAAEIESLENLNLTGIYTYRGAVLDDGSPTVDLERAGRLEGEFMVSVAEEIREVGVPVEDV